jgi:CelD/BcsL family acetyltransferase involved in cellulose biosynthesis
MMISTKWQGFRICELDREWVGQSRRVWNELVAQSNANPVFTSWAWVASWLETIGRHNEIKVLGLFEGDQLIAVLPLLIDRRPSSLWGRHVSLVGGWQADPDYSDLLCAIGYESIAVEMFATWIIEWNEWIQCEFQDVLPEALVRRMAQLMEPAGVVEDAVGSGCPRLLLVNGWDHILKERFDRKRRYNIERQIRLATERQHLRMVIHETPEAVRGAFPVLLRLHDERKTMQGIRSQFSRDGSREFHSLAAVRLSESRAAFIAVLETEEEVVAAAYCMRDLKRLYYFQTGVSASGIAQGAGSTLLYLLIRWAAEQGLAWFDFLKGDEEYKKSWMTEIVEQRTLRISRKSSHGRLAFAMRKARRNVSTALRSWQSSLLLKQS